MHDEITIKKTTIRYKNEYVDKEFSHDERGFLTNFPGGVEQYIEFLEDRGQPYQDLRFV